MSSRSYNSSFQKTRCLTPYTYQLSRHINNFFITCYAFTLVSSMVYPLNLKLICLVNRAVSALLVYLVVCAYYFWSSLSSYEHTSEGGKAESRDRGQSQQPRVKSHLRARRWEEGWGRNNCVLGPGAHLFSPLKIHVILQTQWIEWPSQAILLPRKIRIDIRRRFWSQPIENACFSDLEIGSSMIEWALPSSYW